MNMSNIGALIRSNWLWIAIALAAYFLFLR